MRLGQKTDCRWCTVLAEQVRYYAVFGLGPGDGIGHTGRSKSLITDVHLTTDQECGSDRGEPNW